MGKDELIKKDFLKKNILFRDIVIAVILLAIAIAFFTYSLKMENVELHKSQIQYLNQKQADSKALIGVSTGISVLLSTLPTDWAAPIAEKFADIAGYFAIALGCLILEKYLLSIISLVAFRFVIPIGLIAITSTLFVKRSRYVRSIAIRLVVFALILASVIPCSIKISKMIEETYSISVEDLQKSENIIAGDVNESNKEQTEALLDASSDLTTTMKRDFSLSGVLDFTKDFFENLKDKVSELFDSAGNLISNGVGIVGEKLTALLDSAKATISNMFEALMVVIITSCVIPVLVFMFMLWVSKIIWGLNVNPMVMIPRKPVSRFMHRDSSRPIDAEVLLEYDDNSEVSD